MWLNPVAASVLNITLVSSGFLKHNSHQHITLFKSWPNFTSVNGHWSPDTLLSPNCHSCQCADSVEHGMSTFMFLNCEMAHFCRATQEQIKTYYRELQHLRQTYRPLLQVQRYFQSQHWSFVHSPVKTWKGRLSL